MQPVNDQVVGWQLVHPADSRIALDGTIARNGASLRLEGGGNLSAVRSQPFPAPKTGRLSMHVWLRRPPTGPQPSLRLAIEGQLYGQPYYRFASVDAPVLPTEEVVSEWAPFVLHIDDLPDDGLTDLQVRFDLMGPGTIWLDDVELYDLSFTRAEQRQTSKVIALADLQLREGRLTDCWQTLDRFWPRYIRKYVTAEPSELASLPTSLGPLARETASPTEVEPTANEPAKRSPTGPLRRMRELIPRMPWN